MANLKRILPAFFMAVAACFSCTPAPAETVVKDFRIGLISADPGQLLHDFDPFVQYLRSSLRSSGIRNVTVFVAKDLNQMRGRIQKGRLDFILTTAFPVIQMDGQQLVPAVVGLREGSRDDRAVFFVQKESPLRDLTDLRGKTVVFGAPWSTAAYAMAIAELKKNQLSIREATDQHAPEDAVRYVFAGEALNQAFRVIRSGADAGVFSSRHWEALPSNEQSRLRIIHRTDPITGLFGSFHPAFPLDLREAVEKELIDMCGNTKGQAALAAALNMTGFERLTQEDRNSLQRLKQELSEPAEP